MGCAEGNCLKNEGTRKKTKTTQKTPEKKKKMTKSDKNDGTKEETTGMTVLHRIPHVRRSPFLFAVDMDGQRAENDVSRPDLRIEPGPWADWTDDDEAKEGMWRACMVIRTS